MKRSRGITLTVVAAMGVAVRIQAHVRTVPVIAAVVGAGWFALAIYVQRASAYAAYWAIALTLGFLEALLLPALRHRIILNFDAHAEGQTTETILDKIIPSVMATQASVKV